MVAISPTSFGRGIHSYTMWYCLLLLKFVSKKTQSNSSSSNIFTKVFLNTWYKKRWDGGEEALREKKTTVSNLNNFRQCDSANVCSELRSLTLFIGSSCCMQNKIQWTDNWTYWIILNIYTICRMSEDPLVDFLDAESLLICQRKAILQFIYWVT